MTQAFNLSQLANKVNTSGQLDASTGLVNITPVANGGTGRSSVTSGRLIVGAGTSAMTELAGTSVGDAVIWNGTTWSSGTSGGAAPQVNAYVAPATWTKPATLKGIKVTVVGSGGNGGPTGPGAANTAAGGGGGGGAAIRWLSAPAIPGPIAVTAGSGTNSFGALASATGGATGSATTGSGITPGGSGGSGSGGNVNFNGVTGGAGVGTPGSSFWFSGAGGASILGGGGLGAIAGSFPAPAGINIAGTNGGGYGGGGGGGAKSGVGPGAATTTGTGTPGIVIVEEFY